MKILTPLLIIVLVSSAAFAAEPACPTASDPPKPKGSVRSSPQVQQSIELHCGSQAVTQTQSPASAPLISEKTATTSGFPLLEGISKLIAIVIWPIFGLIVLLVFRRQVSDLIGRIQTIEILGNNKVIVESKLAPTPSAQQTAKSSRETEEAAEAEQAPQTMLRPIRRNALLAEDLALRALQEEYGAPIRRQVTAGADPGFDGAFVSDDRLYIVEVKYYRTSFLPDKLRTSIAALSEAITRYGWSKVHIVLAAVFDELDDAYTKTLKLNQAVASSTVPVIVRTFSMAELHARFGLPPNTDG